MSQLLTVLLAERAKIAGSGEDAYAYDFNAQGSGYIAVFDGCGGMGAKRYPAVDGKSGAYIGSRLAACLTDRYHRTTGAAFDGSDPIGLRDVLAEAFARVKTEITPTSGLQLKGDLFKDLPTTASIVFIRPLSDGLVRCEYLWAGDSRGYFLDGQGMCQVTSDEVYTEEDAFTSLRNDARLRNVIHAGGGFSLSSKIIDLATPSVVITATDGAFGYLLTPAHFEYIVLHALYQADSVRAWQENIEQTISEITGDDHAFIAAVYGAASLEDVKQYFLARFQILQEQYIAPCEGASDEQLWAIWERYRKDYYRR